MLSLNNVFRFPKMGMGPIPFYEHPYKLLAITPLTLLFWRTVQIAGDLGGFERRDFLAVHLAGLTLHGYVNFKIFYLMKQHDYSCRLFDSAIGAATITAGNLFEVIAPGIFNKFAKEPMHVEDIIIVRAVFVAVSVILLFAIVAEANKDRLYRAGVQL